ncbi:MAG: hypothetical protein ABSC94_11775 [Polyangiaceae bacterium]|jgi:hypothetical protein
MNRATQPAVTDGYEWNSNRRTPGPPMVTRTTAGRLGVVCLAAASGYFEYVAVASLAVGSDGCAQAWNFGDVTLVTNSEADGEDASMTEAEASGGPIVDAGQEPAVFDAVDTGGESALEPPACGFTVCSGTCTDTESDNRNCGACGAQCTLSNQICSGGMCTCASGYHVCNGECSSNDSILSCGTSCTTCIFPTGGTFLTCTNGVCGSCDSLSTLCGATTQTPYCANLLTNAANCGGCGQACFGGDGGYGSCVDGGCL